MTDRQILRTLSGRPPPKVAPYNLLPLSEFKNNVGTGRRTTGAEFSSHIMPITNFTFSAMIENPARFAAHGPGGAGMGGL